MNELALFLCIIVVSYWLYCVHRESSIGIGVRYLSVMNIGFQFLIGPMVYWLSGEPLDGPLEVSFRVEALLLALAGLFAFTIGGYVLVPRWARRRFLPQADNQAPEHELDLSINWLMAKIIFGTGLLAQLLIPFAYSLPTVRAFWS